MINKVICDKVKNHSSKETLKPVITKKSHTLNLDPKSKTGDNTVTLKSCANEKLNKIKNMNNDLMSKLEMLLKNPYEDNNSNSTDYNSNYNYANKDYLQLNEELNPEKPRTELNKKRKAFLTDVELEDGLLNKKDDMYDNFLIDEDLSMYSKEQIDEAKDFERMIREVDNMRSHVRTEFDQLQYLIKYVKDTKNKVNRHMYGVKNLADQAGIKKKIDPLTSTQKGVDGVVSEDEEDDDNPYDENGEYKKQINLNKVTENIFNIQDNVIGYYQNFTKNMRGVEENNAMIRKIIGNNAEDLKDVIKQTESVNIVNPLNKINYNSIVGVPIKTNSNNNHSSILKTTSNNNPSSIVSSSKRTTKTDFAKEVNKLRYKSSSKY